MRTRPAPRVTASRRSLWMALLLSLGAAGQSPEPGARPAEGTQQILFGETLRIEVPGLPAPGRAAYLSFDARIGGGRFRSGSASACVVAVNGIPTSLERLRNKAPYYFYSSERRVFWYIPSRSAWVLSYYPWDNTTKAGGHVNRFVLDVTDLMKRADNVVSFTSLYRYGANDKPLEFRNIELLFSDDFPKSSNLSHTHPPRESHGLATFRKRARGRHTGVLAKLNTALAYRPQVGEVKPCRSYRREFGFELLPSGRMVVSVGADTYDVFSSIRFGDEAWRDIGHGDSPGQWERFEVVEDGLQGQTRAVAWQRRVTREDSHLEIRDTFTNRTGHDQPVMFVNMVDFGKAEDITELRLAGQMRSHFYACTSPMADRLTGATPLAYVAMKNSAVGMVLEDDAYRNQTTWMTWDAVLAAGDDLFYLAPKSSYTVVWKIYPLERPDYYDLVNAVRHDWHLFQRIPGLFGFVHPSTKQRMYEDARYKTAEERARFVRDTGIGIASSTFTYLGTENQRRNLYGGEPVATHRRASTSFVEWRDMVRGQGADVKCLPYMDIHICRLTDGETLEGLRQRFPDALPLNAWGEPVAYRTGWLYCVLPQLGNSVGKRLMQMLDLYVDELGFDGIYLDEWDHSRARVSYGHSDGVSALLDEQGSIVRKIGFVPILSKEFHVAFAGELMKRNAVIFANQFDDTLAAAQLPIVHFAEPAAYDSYLLRAAQLSRSPLSLHVKPWTNLFETVREFLKRGVLTCYYWYYLHGDHVLKRCYPITVREIRPGVVIGDDRIITCAGGSFTLGHTRPLRVYVYGAPNGLLERTLDKTRRNAQGHTVVDLQLTDGQVAVVVEE